MKEQNNQNRKKLILASASPRRRKILSSMGFEFAVVPSDAREISGGGTPEAIVYANAKAKACEVAGRDISAGAVVLGADTLVCLDDEILGKPADESDAFRMLSLLSGRAHRVLTGYFAISPHGAEEGGVCATSVRFRRLSHSEIESYISTGEPFDKAGAYGIQELGGALVERVDGDFSNVVGLPAENVKSALARLGVFPCAENRD